MPTVDELRAFYRRHLTPPPVVAEADSKRRRGRPPKPQSERRVRRTQVKWTEAEWLMIKKVAEERGMSVTQTLLDAVENLAVTLQMWTSGPSKSMIKHWASQYAAQSPQVRDEMLHQLAISTNRRNTAGK